MALIVGIDVGRTSAHQAVILRRDTGSPLGRTFRFTSSVQGFRTLFSKITASGLDDEPVDFVIDSPSKAWIPLAAVLIAKGFTVYRPSAYRARKLREAGHRKNKSNRIDALTLARCLHSFPDDTYAIMMPHNRQATLDQLVRQRDRIVDSARRRKVRIQTMWEAITPGLHAYRDFLFTVAGRAFLRQYLDPHRVVRLGAKRLELFLTKRYHRSLPPTLVEDLIATCADAIQIYGPVRDAGTLPFDVEVVQDDLNWELDQLEREEARIRTLTKRIVQLNRRIDPSEVLISLPGVHHVIAAGIRSCIIDIDRFPSILAHRGYAGLYPSVRGTGDRYATGQRISKMSSNRYKRYMYLAAENGYKRDVEMAAFYDRCRARGHTHTQAVCAVANAKVLPRIHRLLKAEKYAQTHGLARPRYVYRDLSGNPISRVEASALVQARKDASRIPHITLAMA